MLAFEVTPSREKTAFLTVVKSVRSATGMESVALPKGKLGRLESAAPPVVKVALASEEVTTKFLPTIAELKVLVVARREPTLAVTVDAATVRRLEEGLKEP